jgi:hypothetical protein
MNEEQRAKQRISFAYGNAAIDNPEVKRELVEKIALKPTVGEVYYDGNEYRRIDAVDESNGSYAVRWYVPGRSAWGTWSDTAWENWRKVARRLCPAPSERL